MIRSLETDYLIIGAGAMGMAFADELVNQSRDVRIILVDRRATPGGHWNDAYRFVRLHQPALYYGVNSTPLGAGGEDRSSGAEITAYYERVLEKLCATGQVRFFGQCDYEGDGRFRSTVTRDRVYQVTVHRKTVDATYSRVEVPATREPAYAAAEGVRLVAINHLAELKRPWSRYVVIGAGKTGIDALLHLLESGVDPDHLTWIISNDVWFIIREHIMPEPTSRMMPMQLRCMMQCEDLDDVFIRFEEAGWIARLDKEIWPTRFRCATVSLDELSVLQRLPHKVRMGRVRRIDPTQIVLEEGVLPTHEDVLHIDCTAHGLARRPARPVFHGDGITLQPVMTCQPAFSAALIGMVELRQKDEATKNGWCRPVPHPEFPRDILPCTVDNFENALSWLGPFGWWLRKSRLSITHHFSWLETLRLLFAVFRWMRPANTRLRRIDAALDQAGSGSGP